jgi:beta-glucosidase
VQVYSADPPRLVGFARVEIAAGDAHAVEIVIPFERFAVRDATRHAMVVRPGRYALRVARSAADAGIGLEVDVSPA